MAAKLSFQFNLEFTGTDARKNEIYLLNSESLSYECSILQVLSPNSINLVRETTKSKQTTVAED